MPDARIRLEYPIEIAGKIIYLDFWARCRNSKIAIELKYKTRQANIEIDNEQYALKNQSAQDIGRYDFLKDVQRLEQIVSNTGHVTGYAILLTNDRSYWNPSQKDQTVDADFRIHEGRMANGKLVWAETASAGTMLNRESPIVLRNNYQMIWEDYSNLDITQRGQFRYLCIKVPPSKF